MTREELIQTTDAFLLDLDGTVYLGDVPIGEAATTLSRLRAMGKRLVFLTNNSSKTQEEYREKLTRLALWGEGDLVYTSAMATVSVLRNEMPSARVFLLATDAVREEFVCAGVHLDENSPDVCVLAYDTQITFEKIKRFDAFLKRGAKFIATHPDDVCPTEDLPMPDVGSFLALFERSSGRRPDRIVGKPYSSMAEEISRLTGVKRERMCMVGDRLNTDIRFAENSGMKSLLVLSGETTEEMLALSPVRPHVVLERLDRLFV